MRKSTLLMALTCLTFINMLGQTINSSDSNLEKAQKYLSYKGEVCFTFQASNKQQIEELSRFLSYGHKPINRSTLQTEAYANEETFQKFLAYGLEFEVKKEDNELSFDPHKAGTSPQAIARGINARAAWDTTWDAYPKYSEYTAKMQYYATTYPTLCSLESIGTTQSGRELWVLKITDNISVNEGEPEFFYTSSMHGDEIAGFPLMIRLIDYLLTNYGTDTEVTNLVNSTEIYINPSANPDGTYRLGDTDAVDNPRRANDSNVDLNRNYVDNVNGLHDDGNSYELETLAFKNFAASKNFVLSANFHGGVECVNYPNDNAYVSQYTHPDGDYFEYISVEYALNAQGDSPSGYMEVDYDSSIYPSPGVTHGAEWYRVYGGRQDYMNYYNHTKEVTIELSNTKWISGAQLPNHWNYNKQAFLDYMKQADYGLHGTITDESGNPVVAEIRVAGHDERNSFRTSESGMGEYQKLMKGGTYNVTYSAAGYTPQTLSVTLTDNTKTVQDVTLVATTSNPTTAGDEFCDTGSVTLNATGTGTLNWYDSADGTTPIFTGPNFTTPTITETTSYFVESVVSKTNVGSTTNNTGGGNYTTPGTYLIFDCTESVKLEQVTINSQSAGELTVELQNSAGEVIDAALVFIPSSGIQTIDLNFTIPVDNDLRLVGTDFSTGGLYRNNSGVSYPYNNGSISIKNSSAGTAYYYFFYDWKIGSIKSAREEAVVTVNAAPNADFSHIVDGANNGNVDFTNASVDSTSYAWDFGDGTGTSTDPNPSYTYASSGTYTVQLTSTNPDCGDDIITYSVTVTVDTLGLEDNSLLDFEVYPNPFTNSINIKLPSALINTPLNIELYDIYGRVVKRLQNENQNQILTIDANHSLSTGSYFLKVVNLNTDQSIIKQVIKR